MPLKVTVCEMQADPDGLARDWERLVAHVREHASEVVLLPEMPFYPWIARTKPFDAGVWQEAVQVHEAWTHRLQELAPATILSSRPVNRDHRRLNEGFVWEPENGYRAAHHKYYLPDEAGYWEASWYRRGEDDFTPLECSGLYTGFLICTELWFMQRARDYGKRGVHLLVNPRTTEQATVDRWLVGGRAAAIVSGAFVLSSNRVGADGPSPPYGGQGWIIGPDGRVMGLTSHEQPFVTVEIDPREAERAQETYPRYVLD